MAIPIVLGYTPLVLQCTATYIRLCFQVICSQIWTAVLNPVRSSDNVSAKKVLRNLHVSPPSSYILRSSI